MYIIGYQQQKVNPMNRPEKDYLDGYPLCYVTGNCNLITLI